MRHRSKYRSPTTFNLLHSKSTYFYKWWNYIIPSVCILALLVGLYVSVNPNVLHNLSINQVSAWDNITTDPGETGSGDSDTTEPSLSLTVDGADQAATPAEVGTVAYRYNTITVAAEGYKTYNLTLSAMLGSGSELHGKNNPNATISGVGENVPPTNFSDNKWGYAVTDNAATDGSALTYSSVPDYNSMAQLASEIDLKGAAVEKKYKLAFAAKFGADAPSDNYQGQLLLSVVGTPGHITYLEDLTYMQQMTAEICADTKKPSDNNGVVIEKQLVDTRDGKKYWVAKLKDGNCWMTQNLDYDIKVGDFTGAVATRTGDINTGWSGTQTEAQSWDPGIYYYKYVSASDWTNCGASLANMSGCPSKGNWSTTAPAIEGEHYHVGNYYSWNAATAGTGGSITSGEATSSICPKGWKLPTSNNTAKGSFGYLMGQYGLRTNNGSELNVDKVRLEPLYFIPAGYVNADGLNSAGNNGNYWSSIPVSDGAGAYNLFFYSGNLTPSSLGNRYYGLSVRCLADF